MNKNKRIITEPYLSRARNLRKQQIPWEAKLWYFLRAGRFYGLNFKRQVPIGTYIIDLSCRSKMIVVELDGGQHSQTIAYDKTRSKFLEKRGYKVLRFGNNEVDVNIQGVLETIKRECGV